MSDNVSPTRVLIVAQIRLYREGLAHALDAVPGIQVAGTTASTEVALQQIRDLRPEVTLIDLATAGAWQLIEVTGQRLSQTRVIAITMDDSDEETIRAAEAGVAGLVPRDGSLEDLREVIRRAMNDEFQCTPRVAHQLVQRIRSLAAVQPLASAPPPLTGRELEIAELLDGGLSNKEIAARLWIEESTVKNHVHNILNKLGVRRRGEASAKLRPLLAQLALRRRSLDRGAS